MILMAGETVRSQRIWSNRLRVYPKCKEVRAQTKIKDLRLYTSFALFFKHWTGTPLKNNWTKVFQFALEKRWLQEVYPSPKECCTGGRTRKEEGAAVRAETAKTKREAQGALTRASLNRRRLAEVCKPAYLRRRNRTRWHVCNHGLRYSDHACGKENKLTNRDLRRKIWLKKTDRLRS